MSGQALIGTNRRTSTPKVEKHPEFRTRKRHEILSLLNIQHSKKKNKGKAEAENNDTSTGYKSIVRSSRQPQE